MLAVVILLACLTTSIGLMMACGEYFHTLMPKISYKIFVTIFTTFCFVVANFGLSNIITLFDPGIDVSLSTSGRINAVNVLIAVIQSFTCIVYIAATLSHLS